MECLAEKKMKKMKGKKMNRKKGGHCLTAFSCYRNFIIWLIKLLESKQIIMKIVIGIRERRCYKKDEFREMLG